MDDETSAAAIDFMKRQHAAGKPFFTWFGSTRMHLTTHARDEHRGRYQHGDSEYIDGMMEHDNTIGTILNALDEMGIADDTIVFTSDNRGGHGGGRLVEALHARLKSDAPWPTMHLG